LEARIEEFHEKENKLKGRFNPLSLYPTVVFPNILFGLAFLAILMGIYLDAQAFLLWLILFLGFMMMGLIVLASALTMIQKAARESG
jgi:F0F1-type ATP synthase assembly protein I